MWYDCNSKRRTFSIVYKGKRRKFYELNEQEKLQYVLNMESEQADVINAKYAILKKNLQNVNNDEWISCIYNLVMVLVFRMYN